VHWAGVCFIRPVCPNLGREAPCLEPITNWSGFGDVVLVLVLGSNPSDGQNLDLIVWLHLITAFNTLYSSFKNCVSLQFLAHSLVPRSTRSLELSDKSYGSQSHEKTRA
jgi:hypothetical protein